MNSIMVLAEGAHQAPAANVHVSPLMWTVSVVGVLALLALDLFVLGRNHAQKAGRSASIKAVLTLLLYVAIFLAVVWYIWHHTEFGAVGGKELFAGWLTEYSLSVDNLFAFLTIFLFFAVPSEYRMFVLSLAISGAVFLRLAFIALGYQAMAHFEIVGFIFGLFLAYTAIKLVVTDEDDVDIANSAPYKQLAKRMKLTEKFYGDKLSVVINGVKYSTPLKIVVWLAMAFDLMFAVDSVPAVLGVTGSQYLAFLATAFALLGMKQLFFFLDAIEKDLVGLKYALGFILGFVAIKLIIGNGIAPSLVNWVAGLFGSKPNLEPYHISTGISMLLIFGPLVVVGVISVIAHFVNRSPKREIPKDTVAAQLYIGASYTMRGEWQEGLAQRYGAEIINAVGPFDTGEGIQVYAVTNNEVEALVTALPGETLDIERPTNMTGVGGIVAAIKHASGLARNIEGRVAAFIEIDARDEDEDEDEIRRAMAASPDNLFVVLVYVSDEPGDRAMLHRLDDYNVSDDRVSAIIATNDDGTPMDSIAEGLEREFVPWARTPLAA